jgi:hypothetical protein
MQERHRQLLGERFRPAIAGIIPQVGVANAGDRRLNRHLAFSNLPVDHDLLKLSRLREPVRG